jgi:hypothetical protein
MPTRRAAAVSLGLDRWIPKKFVGFYARFGSDRRIPRPN